jgi:hypothetical protein
MAGLDDPTTKGPIDPVQSYFLANAPPGSPLSYQSLMTRRKIAEALLGKRDRLPFPKNPGEGIAYASEKLADAFGDRTMLSELDTAERRQALGEAALRRNLDPYATSTDTPASTATSTATSAAGNTGVPYVPPAPAGSVPLPPPRPVRDRSQQVGELNEDPALMERYMATVAGEVPDPQQRAIVAATVVNRARARNIPVAQALETYSGPGSRGYYPADALARGQRALQDPAQRAAVGAIITDVMRGADPSTPALGFEATGNASGRVAQNGMAPSPGGGPPRYGNFGQIRPGGETFVTQETPEQLGRLTPFPRGGPDTDPGNTGPDIAQTPPGAVPGSRDAIAADVMSATPLEQQQPFGAPPAAPTVPPPVQTAALGGAGGLTPGPGAPGALMAGAVAPMRPAGGFTPPVPPGAQPVPGPAAALSPPAPAAPAPAAPYATPPNVQPDIMTRPVQAAQAPQGLRSPADILNEGMVAPVKVQVPPHPGSEPTPPKPPQPTARMRELSNIATSVNVSKETQLWAKDRYDELAQAENRKYELAKEDYNFKRGRHATDLEAHQKGLRNLPVDQLKVDLEQNQLALLKAKSGPEIEKLRLEADQIRQAMQYKAPDTLKFENGKVGQWDYKTGTYKDITPQVNPMDIEIPAEIGKKLEFYVRAKKASSQLEGDASSLANLANALATRKGGIFGPYFVDEKFQRDYSIAKAWGQAVLRDESGANLPEKEVERKMDTYWPMPGEGPKVIAEKTDRRLAEEASLYLALGKARPVANFYLERQTSRPEGERLYDPATKKRYVVRNGLLMDAD